MDEALRTALETDLENAHRAARESLGFKRKDITVEIAGPAAGVLRTPAFEYRVEAEAEDGDARWLREIAVTGVEADRVLPIFADLLDTVLVRFAEPLEVAAIVDRLEARSDSSLRLDYDMRCRWCEVVFDGLPARVRLEGKEMRVVPEAGSSVPVTELWSWVREGGLGA